MIIAHRHSAQHRAEVEASSVCGCFDCLATFAPSVIVEWTDADEYGIGQTALCPKCGIDSVIGDASGYPITQAFLGAMRAYWFEA